MVPTQEAIPEEGGHTQKKTWVWLYVLVRVLGYAIFEGPGKDLWLYYNALHRGLLCISTSFLTFSSKISQKLMKNVEKSKKSTKKDNFEIPLSGSQPAFVCRPALRVNKYQYSLHILDCTSIERHTLFIWVMALPFDLICV